MLLEDGIAQLLQVRKQERLETLEVVAPHLRSAMLAIVLDSIWRMPDPTQALDAVIKLLPCVDEGVRISLLTEGVSLARRIGNVSARARGLAKLGPKLTEPLRTAVCSEALDAGRGAHRETTIHVFAALAPLLSRPELDEAIELAKVLDDVKKLQSLLSALAPHLSPAQLERAVTIASSHSLDSRAVLLKVLSVERLPRPALYRVVHDVIEEMGRGTRREALALLSATGSALKALGGSGAMNGVASSLLDVVRWWP